jgi:hypothetical protein
MKDVYDSIWDVADKLSENDPRYRTVKVILQQTTECAFFVSNYASRGYGKVLPDTYDDMLLNETASWAYSEEHDNGN